MSGRNTSSHIDICNGANHTAHACRMPIQHKERPEEEQPTSNPLHTRPNQVPISVPEHVRAEQVTNSYCKLITHGAPQLQHSPG